MAAEKPTVINDDKQDTPSQAPLETPAETAARIEHYIRFNSGDSLEVIAKNYETTVEAIIKRNNLNPAALQVGHWLYV